MPRDRQDGRALVRRAEQPRDILVVEDDPEHCEAVRDLLEEEGYRVRAAGDGRDALERLLAGPPPDLILLDLRLPKMDGWAFMAELKARPDLARIPVVVTSQGGAHLLNTAPVSAGYLEKPLDRSRLLQTIETCLLRRQRSESLDHG
jgi:CheY-like chemotaxis protein